MAGRNIARVFAPLALVVAFGGVIAVIAASGSGGQNASAPTATQTTPAKTQTAQRRRPRVYVVKAGDTLTVIAQQTGVSLETIEELNPDVDPQALQTGQRLKLGP